MKKSDEQFNGKSELDLQGKPEIKLPPAPAEPGSYILVDGKWVPDLSDPVMKAREAKKNTAAQK